MDGADSSFFALDVGWKHAVLLGKADETVVTLAHAANLAADSVRLVFARHATRLLVNHRDVDLERKLIWGGND